MAADSITFLTLKFSVPPSFRDAHWSDYEVGRTQIILSVMVLQGEKLDRSGGEKEWCEDRRDLQQQAETIRTLFD